MPYLANDEIEIQVEKSFETSKKNLKTDFINAYILHSPVYPGSKLQRVWQKMEEFYDKKEVGQLGISNCYDLDVLVYLYTNARIKPSIVQNRFYAQSGYDKEIRAFCKKNAITYESFWSLTANPNILSNDEKNEIINNWIIPELKNISSNNIEEKINLAYNSGIERLVEILNKKYNINLNSDYYESLNTSLQNK